MSAEKKDLAEISSLEKKFTIKIFTKDVDAAVLNRLKKLGKSAKISGFRPGKIPLKVLQKQYGPQAQADAMNDVIALSYEKAISEKGLIPAGPPIINPVETKIGDSSEKTEIEFNVQIEVMPKIMLPDRKKIIVKKSICSIKDGDIIIDGDLQSLYRSCVGTLL